MGRLQADHKAAERMSKCKYFHHITLQTGALYFMFFAICTEFTETVMMIMNAFLSEEPLSFS